MGRHLEQLVSMTRALGQPDRDYVILSEGNTSVRADEETFWVKASGCCMQQVDAGNFVRVRTNDVLDLLDGPTLPESKVRDRLAAAKVDPDAPGVPSIETALHALCLILGGATFVGHTHPTPVNAILCARDAQDAFFGSIFPAESMICGEPLFVRYAPPGQPLARAVQKALQSAIDDRGEPPRTILLQNHGLVTLGATPQEVLDVTAMMVKTARILTRTYALGGPRFVDYDA